MEFKGIKSINEIKGSGAFYAWVLFLLFLLFLGLYAIVIRFTQFEESLGVSQWMQWGILISTYVFLAVTSTGIAIISSFGHIFGIKKYELIGKRGIILAIFALISAFVAIGMELEFPYRLTIYYILAPNFSSPIWWMGFWYCLSLMFKFGELLFVIIMENHKLGKIAGIGSLLFGIAGISTLGAVFGVISARPLWYGSYMSLYFIISGLISGAAVLIIVNIGVHWAKKEEMSTGMRDLMLDLGKLLALFLVIGSFTVIWRTVISVYGHIPGGYESAMILLTGSLRLGFWGFEIVLGILIPLILLLYLKRTIERVFAAAVMVLVGMFVMRYDYMVAGQLVPVLGGQHYAVYFPSYVEILIAVMAMAFCALMYTLCETFLHLEEEHEAHEGEEEAH